jgi:hypothetical protein
MSGWATIDLMNRAGSSLGGGLTDLAQRRQAEKSFKAFKEQWSDKLGLPTAAPTAPTPTSVASPEEKQAWIDSMMRKSAASAELAGYENANKSENQRRQTVADALNQSAAEERKKRGLPPPVPTEVKPVQQSVFAKDRTENAKLTWQDALTGESDTRAAVNAKMPAANKKFGEEKQKFKMYQDYLDPQFSQSLGMVMSDEQSRARSAQGRKENALAYLKEAGKNLTQAIEGEAWNLAPESIASAWDNYNVLVAKYNDLVEPEYRIEPQTKKVREPGEMKKMIEGMKKRLEFIKQNVFNAFD